MVNDVQRAIEQALSLRAPQKESLDILVNILDRIQLSKDVSVEDTLRIIQEIAPSVKDFERDFPCLCFSIATGVGKTRLMGAMIAYLYLSKGIKNFMVLAPNLNIYNKLKTDFTPNTPKYVFPGIPDFAINPPQIITGEDYNQVGNLFDNLNDEKVRINIFNISKIDSDADKEKSKNTRGVLRVRKMSEYLGQSYFDYLSSLKDLVLIMDEAHRYRANASMSAINELNPVLGIELTATAKSTGSKEQPFKNIVYEYNLAHAISDGFVKEPAVVGRSDFDINLYGENSDELENLKIKDAIKVHESIKAELQVYSDNKRVKLVKPFIMIIAENIKHAEDIKAKIDNDSFENGHYKDKVIVVNSGQKEELRDEVLQRLLSIENAEEPTEIVIHVNMLGEGWDVNNLYTIVPLRAANSKILVEQSIGRGLRLPFGKLTGNNIIDRLHVISHDKFADIIKTAREGKFEFQQEYIDNSEDGIIGKIVTESKSKLDELVENGKIIAVKPTVVSSETSQKELPIFTNELNKQIGESIREAISDVSHYVVNNKDLMDNENQDKITQIVTQKIKDIQLENSELSFEPLDIPQTVKNYTENFIKLSINIPRIKVMYEQQGDFTFDDFDIDVSDFNGYQPLPQKIIIASLLDKSEREEMNAEFVDRYEDITHYLMVNLIEEMEIDYSKNADLLNKLVNQVINYITSYSGNELNTRKILFFYGKEISKKIYYQMKSHFRPAPIEMKVKVDSGYAPITSASYKISTLDGLESVDYRSPIKDKEKIRNITFNGFNKCLFDKQKFDSSTEKDICEILENSSQVLKWFKISNDRAKEVFDIKYIDYRTDEYKTYLPDFIVETIDKKYMIETKADIEIDSKTVQAKKDAAVKWCEYATQFERKNDGKDWIYLLIPDKSIVIGRSFEKLIADYNMDHIKQNSKDTEDGK